MRFVFHKKLILIMNQFYCLIFLILFFFRIHLDSVSTKNEMSLEVKHVHQANRFYQPFIFLVFALLWAITNLYLFSYNFYCSVGNDFIFKLQYRLTNLFILDEKIK